MTQRLSRSKARAQPTFDPDELADLIFTPAVGSGVSSHLVRGPDPVVGSNLATGVGVQPATEGVAEPATEVNARSTTVPDSTPVVEIWMTSGGELVAGKKVRTISTAADALNMAEKRVYDVLWSAESAREAHRSRLAQAGYEALVRNTGLSRKTIQRTVDKLIEKGFLEIHTPGDSYTRGATVYRVWEPEVVYERLRERNRVHVARIGPGVVFVKRLQEPHGN